MHACVGTHADGIYVLYYVLIVILRILVQYSLLGTSALLLPVLRTSIIFRHAVRSNHNPTRFSSNRCTYVCASRNVKYIFLV